MLAEIKRQRILQFGAYDGLGTRDDGSPYEFVLLMDPETSETYTLSVDAGCAKRPAEFSLCDLTLDGQVEVKVVTGKDGRARAAKPSPKFRVMAIAEVADRDGVATPAAATNGKTTREPSPAAS